MREIKAVCQILGVYLLVLAACVIAGVVGTGQWNLTLWSGDARATVVVSSVFAFIVLCMAMSHQRGD